MPYEDYLIRESTGEGLPSFAEEHEDYLESFEVETPTTTDPNDSNETGDQQ